MWLMISASLLLESRQFGSLLRLNTLQLRLCRNGCGHQKLLEGPDILILEGCSHRKITSVSLVRIRFDAIFADIDTRWIIHSNHPTVIGFVCLQYIVFLRMTKIWS